MAGEGHERESILLTSVLRGAIGGVALAAVASVSFLLPAAGPDECAALAASAFTLGTTFGLFAFIERHAARRRRSWRIDLAVVLLSALGVLAVIAMALGEDAFVASLVRGEGLLRANESAWSGGRFPHGDREAVTVVALLVVWLALPLGAMNAARARGVEGMWAQFMIAWGVGFLGATVFGTIDLCTDGPGYEGPTYGGALCFSPLGFLIVLAFHMCDAAEALLGAWLSGRDERARDE